MINEKLEFDNYKGKVIMKYKRLKLCAFSIIGIIVLAVITTVDALTDNSISNVIKETLSGQT